MRTFNIIISFDSDYYPECTDKDIMNYISREVAPALARIYSTIPSYIKTTVEVKNAITVDEPPFDDDKED